jgi:hypothetical protein
MKIGVPTSRANSGGTADRRENSRFPVQEDVRYRVLHAKGLPSAGVGKTLDIGSGGILFTTEGRLPMGRLVEVAVNWPVRLGGACPLQFVAVGKVVRSEATKAAVQIARYEFKTRGSSVAASAAD